MQIRDVSGTRTLRFEFTSESQREEVLGRLSKGQVLEARVLDRLPGERWAVRFLGHTFVAESRLTLFPGQIAQTRVDSLGPPLILSLLGGSGSEASALKRALADLGLKDEVLNRAIVKSLMARGLPVTREGVQALRDALVGSGLAVGREDVEGLEEAVARAVFLRSQGLPVTLETLGATLSQVPAGTLGGLIEGLATLLRSLRLPGTSRRELQRLSERVSGTVLKAETLTGEALKKALDSLGLDLEGQLASWITAGKAGLAEGLDGTLRAVLLALQARLRGHDEGALDDATRASVHSILSRTTEALQALDTLQAADLPSSTRESIHLQIPLLADGRVTTADLRITYREDEGGGQRVDPDNVQLSLSVELAGLGPLRLGLSVHGGRATCHIRAADEARAAVLEEHASELESALEGCGYAVSSVRCLVMGDAEDDGEGGPPVVGVDVRV
jgi:hypothetical protein